MSHYIRTTRQFGGNSTRLGFSANLGANGQFFFGTGVTEFGSGVSLFAVVALVLPVRSNISFKASGIAAA